MTPSGVVSYREATSADVPAMAECRLGDAEADAADARMAAYLEGEHHPQHALAPRIAFIALEKGVVVGYIAGHRTRRFGCDGEVQYLYVASSHRRRGIATHLLRLLLQWFESQGATKICANVNVDSPVASTFYDTHGAVRLHRYWYMWEDITSAPPTS
jgi:GNAT superfamily N-acetyltransferase